MTSVTFSPTRPSGPSCSSSRKVCLLSFVCPLPMQFFLRPLIGPRVTWSNPGLSLVDPPPLQNCIAPTIRIGQEILCLPYSGFFLKQITQPLKKEETNHATSPKLYRSYYPHRSRELVSPVCGIFQVAINSTNIIPWV